jgi:hypothetical protein
VNGVNVWSTHGPVEATAGSDWKAGKLSLSSQSDSLHVLQFTLVAFSF